MSDASGKMVLHQARAGMRIVLALVLLFGYSGASSYVLCVSGNGHISVEDVNAGCCPSARNARPSRNDSGAGAASALESFPAGRCGVCTDVSLIAGSDYGIPASSGKFRSAGKVAAYTAADINVPACSQLPCVFFESVAVLSPAFPSIPLRC